VAGPDQRLFRLRIVGVSAGATRELAFEIAERIGGLGKVSIARFFSGAALIAGGVQFGFVIRGSLYLRVDDKTRAPFEAMGAKPFHYAGRSRTMTVASYYEAPAEILEDDETLGQWAAAAHRAAVAVRRQDASWRKRPPRKRVAGRVRKKASPLC